MWKRIEGFYNYEVSTSGKVRNATTKREISQGTTPKGYKTVRIVADSGRQITVSVHRIVAKTFVDGESKTNNEVNHLNENRGDNKYTNLEWTTRKANVNHGQCQNKRRRYLSKPFVIVDPNGIVRKGKDLKKFCRRVGIDYTSMVRVTNGDYKQCKGWTAL